MVSHDVPTDAGSETLSAHERQQRALQRLDDGHSALLDALDGLSETEAFLGSRWSVWEVMQHLLTESFVEALEQIASGEREMLPAFDARTDRIAADVAKLEANYQRFRNLISGLTEEQLDLPATPYNPENNYPALSLLDLIERVSGHEGNHARQVVETRKYVAAFRSAAASRDRGRIGNGRAGPSVPTTTRELLSNADYVIGTQAALAVARPWIRSVELELRPDNREELVNRLVRDIRSGLWSMVVTLGDPAESASGLDHANWMMAMGKVSMVCSSRLLPAGLWNWLASRPWKPSAPPRSALARAAGRAPCRRQGDGSPGRRSTAGIVAGRPPLRWRPPASTQRRKVRLHRKPVRHRLTVAATTLWDMMQSDIGDAAAAVGLGAGAGPAVTAPAVRMRRV